jgi:hypothetical protein
VALFVSAVGCSTEVSDQISSEDFAVSNPDGTVVCHKGHEISVPFVAVSHHLSHGDYLGPCVETVAAAEASSVLVCHKPGPHQVEIEIPFPAVSHHLSHGDFLGPCFDAE